MGSICGQHQQTITIRVMTLNWGGIPNGPFQYYISDYEPQLKVLGNIFEKMCEEELPGFKGQKQLRNLFGTVEKQFKKGRYSPLFDKTAGVKETGNIYDPYHSMTEKEFKKTWNRRYQEHKLQIENKMKPQDESKLQGWKQNLKQYDFLAYKSILRYVYPGEWQAYLKGGKSLEKYVRVTEPFFEFTFLNEDNKVSHFRYGYRKTNSHIFFIQAYSKNLVQFLDKKATVNFFWYKNDKKKLLTIFKKQIFKSQQRQFKEMNLQNVFKDENIDNYQIKDDNAYDKLMVLESPHFIIINLQFTSSRIKSNEMQRLYLNNLLQFFKKTQPYSKKTVIVGGDINQFTNKFPPHCDFFPTKAQQVTTFKKRTALQSQRKKKDVRVKLSRDKIITNRKMLSHKIVMIDGEEPNYSPEIEKDQPTDYQKKENGDGLKSKLRTLLPDDVHPFDQFCVKVEIEIPTQGLEIGDEPAQMDSQ